MNQLVRSQTAKRVLAATASVFILGIFLGWRGSSLTQRGRLQEMEQSIDLELRLANEVTVAKLAQFEFEVFNIVSAEYLQHSSHTPGITEELSESPFSAVGILELKSGEYEPSWWSVNSRSSAHISQELLRHFAVDWQPSIKQMERHFFARVQDLDQEPLMIFLSRIELPSSQAPAIAVAVMPPKTLKLHSTAERELFLWDQKGFIWGYQNAAYVGDPLKNDPLVHASLKSPEDGKVSFPLNGRQRLGVFAHVPESNLFVGISREEPSLSAALASWWISLAIALAGATLIGFVMLRRYEGQERYIEMPTIVVEPEKEDAPVSKSEPELPESLERVSQELEALIEEDTLDPTSLDPEPLKEPIKEEIFQTAPPVQTLDPVKDSASVESVLHRALNPYRHRLADEGIEVKENLPAGLFVKAKPAQLQTALEEIIKNSIDSMTDTPVKKLLIETGLENGYTRITIRDTGCGILAENRDRIFEPFFTTKTNQARGLGLTVVKRLLEIVGGQSRVDSEVGHGTAITLLIPSPTAQIVAPSPVLPPEMPDFMENEELAQISERVEIRKPRVRMFD